MKPVVTALLSGVLFGVGLIVSGMTQPAKVIAFLDFFGAWDPSLALVMGGAIGVHAVTRRLVLRRAKPVCCDAFSEPTRRTVDGRLVTGAALFGLGWGLAGFCPGPAVVSVASGAVVPVVFVIAMLGGMALEHALEGRLAPGDPSRSPARSDAGA